jgi:glycosyltransferase involved in cell wall biosynthesis
MRICVLSDLNSFEGIGIYAQEIYQRLKSQFDLEYLYIDYEKRSLVKDPNGENIVLHKLKPWPLESKPFFWLRIKKHLPVYDLYHIASQNLAFLGKNRKFVLTVHDLIPLFIPGSFFHKAVRKMLFSGIPFARHIMADSEHSKQDVLRVFNVPEHNISVISLGVSDDFRPLDKQAARQKFAFSTDKKYILHIGIDKWRKNLEGAVRALFELRQRMPIALLVRVGKNSKQTEKLIAELHLIEAVISYTHISQQDLVSLYNACDVLLFPSFYEGFGLPVLEAMACGLPVVASNRTSIPEVAGDCAIFTDPDQVEQMAQAVQKTLTDSSQYGRLREQGLARSKLFSWDRTAQAVAQVYAEAM